MIFSYVCLASAILSTAFGQVFYKKYISTKVRMYYIVTIILFIITPIFSFFALKSISIDVVYVFTSLTIFIVMVLSKFFLREQIEINTYIGVFIILVGVIVYAL
jgi:multidrug transporter EmrE-like cation transporter